MSTDVGVDEQLTTPPRGFACGVHAWGLHARGCCEILRDIVVTGTLFDVHVGKNLRVVNNYMPELLTVLVINAPFDCMHASVGLTSS